MTGNWANNRAHGSRPRSLSSPRTRRLRAEARGRPRVIAAFTQAETTIAANEYQVESREVLRLVEESGHTAYDCEFVALAQRLGVPLVTTDKKLLRAFPSIAVSLADAAG